MTVLTATTAGNAATPERITGWTADFTSFPNGALEVIGSADDGDYGEFTTNADHTADAAWLLDDMPGNFGTMDDLAFQVRYGWSATPTDTTWPVLAARIVTNDNAVVLAANASGGGFQTFVTSITDTTPTNSTSTGFTYVNTGASKANWDNGKLEIRITRDRVKGGGTEAQRIYAAEVTGNYTISAGGGARRRNPVSFAKMRPVE
jgi:hypothetical protein